MNKAGFRNFSLAVLMSVLLAGAAYAAGGAVDGQVQDTQGKPLPGAAVTLLHAGGKSPQNQATSDTQGNFHFDGLASGVYVASVTLDGYAPVTCPGVQIFSGLTRQLEVKLAPAGGGAASSCAPAAEPGS